MLIYIYPKCSTCKKALKFLEENKIDFISRNIKEEPPTVKELEEYLKISKKDIKKFFNTSGILYREFGLKDKLNTMEYEEILKLLASDGMLVKRPLVVTDSYVLNGFREKEWFDKIIN